MGPETPDIASSTDDYARRFAGPVGAYLLAVQNRAILDLLGPWRGGTVLDVGGGHAQLCGPLLDAGCKVTVLGSDGSCFERVHRLYGEQVRCVEGDLLAPPFPEQSFDVVVSIRMLAHIEDAEQFIAGLCRTSRQAVIVDYPEVMSINALAPLLYGLKKQFEGNTRIFRMYRAAWLRTAFASQGFARPAARGQFFWPMVLHRVLAMTKFSQALEAPPRALGLTGLFGSPICLRVSRL
jgi:SAM-dependent methyltransferase